jgi:hypothetical protein
MRIQNEGGGTTKVTEATIGRRRGSRSEVGRIIRGTRRDVLGGMVLRQGWTSCRALRPRDGSQVFYGVSRRLFS